MRTVGHRGASALAPENTVRAIRVAIEYRLDFVEVDVHLSRDGELVVHHDPDVVDEHGVGIPVSELTVAELARIPKGDGEFVPTLADVAARLQRLDRHRQPCTGVSKTVMCCSLVTRSWAGLGAAVAALEHAR
jgi:glycerophosphoryl diester phosphodiesterase